MAIINMHLKSFLIAGLLFLAACSRVPDVNLAETTISSPPTSTSTLEPSSTASPSLPPSATATLTITPSPSDTLQPTFTWTPEPYAGYRIEDLAMRSYGGGELVVEEVIAENSYFTRLLVSYPSDGLKIYGFMNVPVKGTPPYPVVIALHGYIEPEIYNTLDYTTRYADALARAGYLVIHPNLRGYPPSDSGDNLFRVGMAIDALNLIALLKAQGGQPGPLELADPQAIGIWGHSMGGGISTRVITVSPDVKAAVLYGAMSGDEKKNFERIFSYFSNGTRGMEELSAPEGIFPLVSPINYLDRIQAAVSIHHGTSDTEVPLEWSNDLCQRLHALGKQVECFTYAGQKHTFNSEGDDLFNMRVVQFYDRVLKNISGD
ncbi:MAG: alpha/beta fold hydrolase [Anaerolineales bacterium]